MLEKEDLVQIRGIMTEVFASDSAREVIHDVVVEVVTSELTKAFIRDVVVESVGEAFEQVILPRLDALETDMAELKTDMAELKTDMVSVKGKLADMVTVDYMDRRLVDQKGELANSGIRASHQVKTLATELHRNGVITADQFVLATAP